MSFFVISTLFKLCGILFANIACTYVWIGKFFQIKYILFHYPLSINDDKQQKTVEEVSDYCQRSMLIM